MDSLPFDYDNLGAAFAYADRLQANVADDCEQFKGRVLARDTESNSAPGTFYDKDGNAYPSGQPPRPNAQAPSAANEYGFLLNHYGEPGDRRVWLTYTRGDVRQAF